MAGVFALFGSTLFMAVVMYDPSLVPGSTSRMVALKESHAQQLKAITSQYQESLQKERDSLNAQLETQKRNSAESLEALELKLKKELLAANEAKAAQSAADSATLERERKKISRFERAIKESGEKQEALRSERNDFSEKIVKMKGKQDNMRKKLRTRVAALFHHLNELHRDAVPSSSKLAPPPPPPGQTAAEAAAAQAAAHAAAQAAAVKPGENAPPANLPVQLKPAAPSKRPRIFDLVLFSAADRDLVPLRIQELRDKVDVIVLAESEFRFSDGQPKPSNFDPKWLDIAKEARADVRHFKIGYTGLEACKVSALKPGGSTKVIAGAKMRKRPGLLPAKCRESFGRNGLVQAFNELGGTEDDIALISDADEIPRAESMKLVRKLTSGRMATSLGAIHHFKYTLRCERGWRPKSPGATWLKGPVATTGRYLRAAGAQSIRTPDGCVEVGVVPHCYGNLNRVAIANASWHMSSLSGGVEGVVRKMRDNAANALYDKNATLFLHSTVQQRAQGCKHGENSNSKGAQDYERTPWGKNLAPRYPDVPSSLEKAFSRRELLHFLSWETAPGARAPTFGWDSAASPAPIERLGPLTVRAWHYRQTWGPCNRHTCEAKPHA